MKRLLCAALLAAGPAMADLVATNGTNELRLMPTPCVHGGVLGMLKPEHRPRFKKAQAGTYVVWYEDGDVKLYQVSAFLDQPGV